MSLSLRETTKSDLTFVLETEIDASKDGYVTKQNLVEHEKYLENEDFLHLIIESDNRAVGYIILAGLTDKNENIEFARIVVSEKGKGYGRKSLKLVKELAFGKLNAHRLWLDVFDFNERARGLYESEGFTVEGIMRECIKNEDTRKSLVLMSILEDEFRKI